MRWSPRTLAQWSHRASPRIALFAFLLCTCLPVSARAGVELILSPAETVIDPGDSFTVELVVPVAMSTFNGYDAVIGYDPTRLRLLPETSKSVREGELMVDACPANRWNLFNVPPDSTQLSISHVLLCAGVSVSGPGVLYRLRFAAKDAIGLTVLQFLPGTRFYDAGEYVDPLVTRDAEVRVGRDTDAPAPRLPLELRAVPNPFNPSTVFHFRLPSAGPVSLRILGVDGRELRSIHLDWLAAGSQGIPWDGTDQQGRRLASGHYLAHLRHASGEAVCGTVLLK